MNNATMTVTIKSINERFDSEGVKICYGLLEFCFYSKDGVTPTQINYRTKGAPAVQIAEAGEGATGVAIGFLDYQTIDKGEYKDKLTSLVIRKFLLTPTPTTSTVPTSSILIPNTDRELVAVAASNNSNGTNGYLATNDNHSTDSNNPDDIPF
ncbi:hypothetical protein WA1_50305 [Scytonema hofmannii PCC 7110]|uniref:Single-stranded DNA-binding protein n=1 Tax=Scytonema hofmannii PCC 7110 TaxID=128403 RepID=A0A139WR67_9CYAN|nr:hypothetical protein [Scytonema hofmannii]KYC34919.1 hypothetical protein WA1_50305 [Scytonema hofmannii PCC 7110]